MDNYYDFEEFLKMVIFNSFLHHYWIINCSEGNMHVEMESPRHIERQGIYQGISTLNPLAAEFVPAESTNAGNETQHEILQVRDPEPSRLNPNAAVFVPRPRTYGIYTRRFRRRR